MRSHQFRVDEICFGWWYIWGRRRLDTKTENKKISDILISKEKLDDELGLRKKDKAQP